MDGRDDLDAWREAIRLEAEGDPSCLAALLIAASPLAMQERVAAILKKLPRQKPVTKAVMRLADAFQWVHANDGGAAPSDALLREACSKFGIKEISILHNTLALTRFDVNPELRRRGLI